MPLDEQEKWKDYKGMRADERKKLLDMMDSPTFVERNIGGANRNGKSDVDQSICSGRVKTVDYTNYFVLASKITNETNKSGSWILILTSLWILINCATIFFLSPWLLRTWMSIMGRF